MRMVNATKILSTLLLLFSLTIPTLASGNTFKQTYAINKFNLGQKNWDVYNSFFEVICTSNGGWPVKPDKFKIELFGQDGALIQTYHTATFNVDDKNLGSGEKLTIRLTATIGKESVMAERQSRASEKSIVLQNDIVLPLEDHISIADLSTDCKLMRAKYGQSDKLEQIGGFEDIGVTLFVSNNSGLDFLQVPVSKKKETIDIAKCKYFEDFLVQFERELNSQKTTQLKYFYQFNWNRNTYLLEGGSKRISMSNNKAMLAAKTYHSGELIQHLVLREDPSIVGMIHASAEKRK
jgi:hypothetical protein